MTVPESIHRALHEFGVIPDDLLLCAVSGGGDSVSLAAAVHAAGFRRVHLAWINHNLRPADQTSRDLKMVQALAKRLAVPVHQSSLAEGEIESRARAAGGGVEQVARQLRYQALVMIAERIAAESTCRNRVPTAAAPAVYLVTGHHRDDQTETVLSRIADGHPATVPVAIPPYRVLVEKPVPVIVVRPALDVAGGALREWGALEGLRWAEDVTNRDSRYRRNALRHQALPHLSRVLPESSRMIARYGRSHDRLLESLAALIPPDSRGRFDGATWVVSREAFLALPEAARELVLRDAAYEVSSSPRVDGGFIGEVLRRLELSGGDASRIEVSGEDLVCVASTTEICLNRDIVPVGQRGYLWRVSAGHMITLAADGSGVVPSRGSDVSASEDTCVACTSIAFPAILREHRPGDALLWRGRRRTLTEVARGEAVPRDSRRGAAVIESGAGIEAVFWRGCRFAVRDGGAWSPQCVNNEPSAVIFRMRG